MAAKFTFKAAQDVIILSGGTDDGECLVVETLSGWGTLSILVEGTADPAQGSSEWVALTGPDLNTGTAAATAITAAGSLKRYDVTGLAYVRVRCSAFTSGTGTIAWNHGKTATRA